MQNSYLNQQNSYNNAPNSYFLKETNKKNE